MAKKKKKSKRTNVSISEKGAEVRQRVGGEGTTIEGGFGPRGPKAGIQQQVSENTAIGGGFAGLDKEGNPIYEAGVKQRVGDRASVGLGATYTPATGKPGVGISGQYQLNDRVSVGAGLGTSGWNVGAQAHLANTGDDTSLDVGLGYGSGGLSVTPTFTWAGSKGGRTGGQVGGTGGAVVGTAICGPACGAVGSLLGSAIGSGIGDLFSGNQKVQMETERRKGLLQAFHEAGFIGNKWDIQNPDGSTFAYDNDKKNPNGYYSYQTDFHKDLDYLASMPGITLSRMLAGRADSKEVDQAGNFMGNAFLGTAGSGGQFNRDNFNTVMNNARAQFAKSGIKSKEEMIALANNMFSQGRINDFDHTTMMQTANIMFDNDFETAQKLMAGRNAGLETAQQTPDINSPTQLQPTQATATPEFGPRDNLPGPGGKPLMPRDPNQRSAQDIIADIRAQGGSKNYKPPPGHENETVPMMYIPTPEEETKWNGMFGSAISGVDASHIGNQLGSMAAAQTQPKAPTQVIPRVA